MSKTTYLKFVGDVVLARRAFAPVTARRLFERFRNKWLVPTALLYQKTWRLVLLRGVSSWAPLSPQTIERKGSSRILIETRQMLDGIRVYKIDPDNYEVGFNKADQRNDGERAAKVAIRHEFGFIGSGGQRVPARPHNLNAHKRTAKPAVRHAISVWKSALNRIGSI